MRIRSAFAMLSLASGIMAACGDADLGDPSEASTDPALHDGSGTTEPVSDPSLTAPYYDLDRVLEVHVTIPQDDWHALRSQTRTLADILGGDCLDGPRDNIFTWFSATVTVDGETLYDVGIRKKGFLGSLSYSKPALKVRFDKYVDDQLLGGVLKRMTLNNVRQDWSKLNTCMSYKVFELAGRPAPRCNFAAVSVNGEYLGLYVHIESIKSSFLAAHFDDPGGNLYEGTISDFRPIWEGSFEKKTHEEAGDFSDIHAVTEALEDPSPDGLTTLAEWVDIDAFLTHWALEVMVAHWDGYAGNRNNFYLYREPAGRFVFIPWGADAAFFNAQKEGQDGEEIPTSVMAKSVIPYRLYLDPEMQAAYVERLTWLLDTVWDEATLMSQVDRMAAIVQTHALSDTLRAQAAEDTQRVRDHITELRGRILSELEPTPPTWQWPLEPPNICWEILGEVDMDFATTWDTEGAEDITQTGQVDVSTYTLKGETQTFIGTGASAGINPDPDAGGGAKISLLNVTEDGTLDFINIFLPHQWVRPGGVLLDEFTATGFRILVPPPYVSYSIEARVGSGAILFGQASLTSGAPITGRVFGTLYGLGGYVSGSHTPDAATPTQALVINEVASSGDPLDWFELYNATDGPLTLSDFLVADDLEDEDRRVPLPGGITVEPGEYIQIKLNKDGWPGFALGNDEALGVWTKDGALVDQVDWPAGVAGAGQSYARIPDVVGDFLTVDTPSPGASNP